MVKAGERVREDFFKEQTDFAKMTREGKPTCKQQGDVKQPATQSPPLPMSPPPPPTPGLRNRSSAVTHSGLQHYGVAGFCFVVIVGKFPGTR